MTIEDILNNIPLDMNKIKNRNDIPKHFSVLAAKAEELGDTRLANALDKLKESLDYCLFGVPEELYSTDMNNAITTIGIYETKEMDKEDVQSFYDEIIKKCRDVKERIKDFVQIENEYKKKHGEASGCAKWEYLHGIWSEITDDDFPKID